MHVIIFVHLSLQHTFLILCMLCVLRLTITIRCTACSVSSVQDGIYALGEARMRSNQSLRSFPKVAFDSKFETVPIVRLIDDGPLSSFQGESSSASSFHASLLQAIDGVMSLALCLQVVSQASQHFR